MRSLSLKNKTIISICAFVLVFAALILVATFYDYQVSQILTKNALKPGDYLSDDLYGVVGEAIGTSPIYLLLAVCTALLCWFFIKCFDDNKYKKWFVLLGIAFGLVGIVAWWYYIKDIFKYLIEHAGATIGSTAVDGALNSGLALDTSVYAYRHNAAVVICELLVAATVQALTVLAFRPLKKETLKKLFWWVVAGLAACLVANIVIILIKEPVGRMRFRAINSDVGQMLINGGQVQGYTRWYERNGQPDESINLFVSKYPGADDAFKSFPSGHTCAAGMAYAMIMLPDVVDFKHKKAGKIACWVTPIVITMLVAISRIVVGAHYMSDVTFGGTLAFVCMIIAREVFICKGSHFFALFPKLAKQKASDSEVEIAVESDEDVIIDEQNDVDVVNEEIAISSEEADATAREIADNLRDGGIIE